MVQEAEPNRNETKLRLCGSQCLRALSVFFDTKITTWQEIPGEKAKQLIELMIEFEKFPLPQPTLEFSIKVIGLYQRVKNLDYKATPPLQNVNIPPGILEDINLETTILK